jgi:hypothetical protein
MDLPCLNSVMERGLALHVLSVHVRTLAHQVVNQVWGLNNRLLTRSGD